MPGLDLTGEEKCKRAFKPWFDAGGWTVQDYTDPESANFQIPGILSELHYAADRERLRPKLYDYVKSRKFQHDGDATRGGFLFSFDYKYHAVSYAGLGIKKADYNKYWRLNKPWFYVLLYAEDKQKIYTHQLRDPDKACYKVTLYGGYEYYNVEDDCVEAKFPDFPFTFPMLTEEMSGIESIALIIAFGRWADNSFKAPFEHWTEDDLQEARRIIERPIHSVRIDLKFRKWRRTLFP